MKRLFSSAAVAFLVATSMLVGVAMPANAAGIGSAWNLWDFLLTIKGSQLLSTMGPAALSAWSPQAANVAAQTANAYNAHTIYGNVAQERLAEVIPLKKPVDVNLGRRIPIGPSGLGIKMPVFSAKQFFNVTPRGGLALGAAITAYEFRGEIANGVLGWFGVDAEGTVCSAGTEPGSFVEFLSGADCNLWQMEEDFETNAGLVPGGTAEICNPGNTACLRYTGEYFLNTAFVKSTVICMVVTKGTVSDGQTIGMYTAKRPTGFTSSFTRLDPNNFVPDARCGGVPGYASGENVQLPDWPNAVPPTQLRWGGSGGTPVPVVETDLDPLRHLHCVLTGSDGIVRTGDTAQFRESEITAWPEPNCGDPLPAGVYPAHILITEEGGGQSIVIKDEAATDEMIQYADEFGELCAAHSCFLDLVRNIDGLSCFGLEAACDGWMTSPTRDADYTCQYGGVAQPVQECYAYANTFNEEKRLSGNAYADPKTGEDVGGGTSLRLDEQMMGSVPSDASVRRACGGQGWGELNPLEWVLRPVQCALEWAFVPRPSVMYSNAQSIQTAWNTSPPGRVFTTMAAWNLSFNIDGCGGVPWNFVYGEASVNLGIPSACPGTHYADVAAWVRVASSIVFVLGAAFTIRSLAGAAIGFNPGRGTM